MAGQWTRQPFAKTGRTFPNGCIRVHDPIKFAETARILLSVCIDGAAGPSVFSDVYDRDELVRCLLRLGSSKHHRAR